jgi:holliday junction resolvase YEN1
MLRWAAEDYSSTKLRQYLDDEWKAKLEDQLKHDPYSFIGRKHPHIATNIPSTFPDVGALNTLVSPITSPPGLLNTLGETLSTARNGDIARLHAIAERLFGWDLVDNKKKFLKYIWDCMCTRELLKVCTHF